MSRISTLVLHRFLFIFLSFPMCCYCVAIVLLLFIFLSFPPFPVPCFLVNTLILPLLSTSIFEAQTHSSSDMRDVAPGRGHLHRYSSHGHCNYRDHHGRHHPQAPSEHGPCETALL